VLGVDVGTRPDLDEVVPREAAAAAALAGRQPPSGSCRIDHDRFGEGYGAPTSSCREALDLAARCEGLLLDPVYSGKAMAGLIHAVRSRIVPDDGTIVFLATGGLPALLTPRYTEWVTSWP
jgi:1-aminocyclopropane-1-carboxylate deaminase/D-cysteine desulfhydrase-like pyridoxal-dependent ACC family enzyme